MQKKNIGVPSKKIKKITSSQPKKLIFGIQPYLTQLDEIHTNNTDWGAITFGIQPINQNQTNWL